MEQRVEEAVEVNIWVRVHLERVQRERAFRVAQGEEEPSTPQRLEEMVAQTAGRVEQELEARPRVEPAILAELDLTHRIEEILELEEH